MINYWLDMGVDGFRCDVINNISKDFSSPYAGGIGPHLHEYLHELHVRRSARTRRSPSARPGALPPRRRSTSRARRAAS